MEPTKEQKADAKAVMDWLYRRKGYDDLWDDIEPECQQALLDELQALLEGQSPSKEQKEQNATPGHTPGPWQAIPIESGVAIYQAECNADICVVDAWSDHPGEQEANARLIAAAPDLVEACKAAMKSENHWHGAGCAAADNHSPCNCWVRHAQAALKKAGAQ